MQVFTVVEDRPVQKERRTQLREVHRVEKRYVIETRFLGERELPGGPKARPQHTLFCNALLISHDQTALPQSAGMYSCLEVISYQL